MSDGLDAALLDAMSREPDEEDVRAWRLLLEACSSEPAGLYGDFEDWDED